MSSDWDTRGRANTPPQSLSASWSMPTTVSHAVSGLLRRFSTDPPTKSNHSSPIHSPTYQASKNGLDGVYTPPYRNASPFQPPPLYPVSLKGYHDDTFASAKLLTKTLAEEIRLLVPPRLQLCEEWNLVYSLVQDGVSLGTMYKKCDDLRGLRNGYVLVVKDGDGGIFGAYLTDAPHPSPHYFGTGECFLWRASVLNPSSVSLANLPPPPSADTTNMVRHTTIGASRTPTALSPRDTNTSFQSHTSSSLISPSHSTSSLAPPTPRTPSTSGVSTPERIRFKAFPYSGVNDYLMQCESGFLSVGGGDGHYGLWLDDNFERGISSHCLTFGNEPLSEEGQKFDIMGVELWSIGNS